MASGREWRLLAKVRRNRTFLLMLAPATLFYLLFAYAPMFGIVLAFENYNLRDGFLSPFVGLKNFRFLFLAGNLLNVAKNTVVYNLIFLAVNTTIAIAVAVLISEIRSRWFKKVTQSAVFLPYFISWVVVGAFAYSLFNYDNGLVGNILASRGMEKVDFYNNASIWPPLLVLFSAWKNVGYSSVVYIAAITGIDPELHEAAAIDGAGIFRRIRYITLPSLVPTIIILCLLAIGNIFRGDFSMFYNLIGNNAILLPSTDVVDTFVTRMLLTSPDVGMAASSGLFQSLVCFATIMVVNRAVRAYDKEYALF